MKKIKILIINGPNINKLGIRQPKIYGKHSLIAIKKIIYKNFKNKLHIKFFQSNSESKIVNYIHKNINIHNIIINPAALSYYSISILDALLIKKKIFIEIHLSNIYKREYFRQKSIFSKFALAVLIGANYYSYIYAINLIYNIRKHK